MKEKIKKPFSCDFVECVAVSDIVFETSKGNFEVSKGSSVLVSVNENQKPVILRKGIKKESGKASLKDFYVEIKDQKIFKDFISEAVVLKEEVKNSVKGVSISKLHSLLVSESMKLEHVIPYIIRKGLVKESNDVKTVILPVKERVSTLSFRNKVEKFDSVKKTAKSPSASVAELKGIKYENSFSTKGIMVNTKTIIEEIEDMQAGSSLKDHLISKLKETLSPEFTFVEEGNVLKFSFNGKEIGSLEISEDSCEIKDAIDETKLNEVLQVVMSLMNDYGNDMPVSDETMAEPVSEEEMTIKKGDAEITFKSSEKPEADNAISQDIDSNESDNEEDEEFKNLEISDKNHIEL